MDGRTSKRRRKNGESALPAGDAHVAMRAWPATAVQE
jgi:hypothetical protein